MTQTQPDSRSRKAFVAAILLGVAIQARGGIETYQAQLACRTPQTMQLLATPLQPDPRANVWVLEVLDAMGQNRVCNDLDPRRFANFLERMAVNDVVREPIPPLATVRDAIAWEKQVEDAGLDDRFEGVTVNLHHLHDRTLSRAFSPAMWAPDGSQVDMLRKRQALPTGLPGVWLPAGDKATAAYLVLTLEFTNVSTRPVIWDARTLQVRHAADSPIDRPFNCYVDGAQEAQNRYAPREPTPPGGKVKVGCSPAMEQWDVKEIDAAWVERVLQQEKQWMLQGPPPEDGPNRHRDTMRRYSSAASHAAAATMIQSMTCEQRLGCIGPLLERRSSMGYRAAVIMTPSALAGAVLLALFSFGQRTSMTRVAPKLIGAIIVALIAAAAWILSDGNALGMGGVLLFFVALFIAGGMIGGVLVVSLWAARTTPREAD